MGSFPEQWLVIDPIYFLDGKDFDGKSCLENKTGCLRRTPKFQSESLTAEAHPVDNFDPHQKHG